MNARRLRQGPRTGERERRTGFAICASGFPAGFNDRLEACPTVFFALAGWRACGAVGGSII
jgi:hypothetical protein